MISPISKVKILLYSFVSSYICLEFSLLWGLFATFVNYLIVPHLNKLAKKIPKSITIILVLLFIIDIIATIIN